MSAIPHQLSSVKVYTMEHRGESNPKHLPHVSYKRTLFVQVLGKVLASGGKRGTSIHALVSGIQNAGEICCALCHCSGKQNGDDCSGNANTLIFGRLTARGFSYGCFNTLRHQVVPRGRITVWVVACARPTW